MTTLLAKGRAGERLDVDIVDMHGHLGRCAFAYGDQAPGSVVAAMDRLGVSAIVCSHVRCLSRDVDVGNAELLEAMRAFPGRILGYVSLYPFDADRVREMVERWLAEGFVGLKLHNANGWPYSDPAYEPAYAIAHERRLPVLFHTSGDDKQFADLEAIAERHPDASLLLAHSGCCNEQGYIDISLQCPNVYLELAGSPSQRGLVERLVAGAGAEKVIWGSDCNFIAQTHQIGKVIGADLPDEVKVRILSTNARRLLARAQVVQR